MSIQKIHLNRNIQYKVEAATPSCIGGSVKDARKVEIQQLLDRLREDKLSGIQDRIIHLKVSIRDGRQVEIGVNRADLEKRLKAELRTLQSQPL